MVSDRKSQVSIFWIVCVADNEDSLGSRREADGNFNKVSMSYKLKIQPMKVSIFLFMPFF